MTARDRAGRVAVRWALLAVVLLAAPRLLGVRVDPVAGSVALLVVVALADAAEHLSLPGAPYRARPVDTPDPVPVDASLRRLTWALSRAHEPDTWTRQVRPVLRDLARADPELAADPLVREVLDSDTAPDRARLAAVIERIAHP